jgi:hypothetical protein
MKEIRNTTARPLRVPLPGGKTLHLGPRNVAQVADTAVDHPGLKKLIEAGTIEVLGKGERVEGIGSSEGSIGHGQGVSKSPFRRGSGER